MEERLSIACAIHDRTLAEAYLFASLDAIEGDQPTRFMLGNEGNVVTTNLAHLYNILKRLDGPPVRLYLHPDVVFEPDFVRRIRSAVDGLEQSERRWGAIGTVGRSWEGEYVWGHEITEPVEVCTLDACCMAIDTRHGILFDERTFDGFHCHVEDYCLQAHAAGLGVYVVPAELRHIGATYATEGARWGSYPKYRRRLKRKWQRRFPDFTTT